jgi:hypothetical protein
MLNLTEQLRVCRSCGERFIPPADSRDVAALHSCNDCTSTDTLAPSEALNPTPGNTSLPDPQTPPAPPRTTNTGAPSVASAGAGASNSIFAGGTDAPRGPVILVVCSWCQTFQGWKVGATKTAISHGICSDCRETFYHPEVKHLNHGLHG